MGWYLPKWWETASKEHGESREEEQREADGTVTENENYYFK